MGLLPSELLLLLLPLLPGGSPQEKSGFEVEMQRNVRTQEGLCVFLPCFFLHSGNRASPAETTYMYWFRDGDSEHWDAPVATNHPTRAVRAETRGRFLLLGDPGANNCSLSIRPARRTDAGAYYLRVERGGSGYSYRSSELHLEVTALTEKPDIHFGEPLRAGRPAKLTCRLPGLCEGHSLNFSWAGGALASMDPNKLRSPELTLTPRPQDHGSLLTCRVAPPGPGAGTERTVRLAVAYAPQTVTVSIAHGNGSAFRILENASSIPIPKCQSLRLVCEAPSNPPASLSWFRGSPCLNTTRISNSTTLELPPTGTPEEGELTCLAQHPLGSQHVSLSLRVQSPPQLLDPSCSLEDEGLLCRCSARAWPAPSLRWRLGERLLEGNSSNTSVEVTFSPSGLWANSSLRLSVGLSSDLTLSCEARNDQGTSRAVLLLLPGKPEAPWAALVQGALGGAGAMAVLSLGLCLLVYGIAKARKDRGRPAARDDEEPVMGTVAWSSGQMPLRDSLSGPAQDSLSGPAPAAEEPQEIHYASLSFHRAKAQEPQGPEASATTEYSEIRTKPRSPKPVPATGITESLGGKNSG